MRSLRPKPPVPSWQIYYDRGNARARLSDLAGTIADAEKAVEIAHGAGDTNLLGRLEQFLALEYSATGDPKKALEIFQRLARDMNGAGGEGYQFGAQLNISAILIQMGDLAQAEAYLKRNLTLIHEARTSGLPGWRNFYANKGQAAELQVEHNRAIVFAATGQYSEAEKSFTLAEQRMRAAFKGILSGKNPPPEVQLRGTVDNLVLGEARMKAKQGRLAEAEADLRRALLSRLKDLGKYSSVTTKYIVGLANILVDEGRYSEAETLMRTALDTNRTIGVAEIYRRS